MNTTVFLATLALFGMLILLLSTRWGIGLSPDSTAYIGVARSLLNGQGFSLPSSTGKAIPYTLQAPLYPALLAFIGLFKTDPLVGARWLNSFLFGANIFLVGHLIGRYCPGSHYAPILGSILMLSSLDMLTIHSMGWTEPTFIFLSLLSISLMAAYAEKRPKLLTTSAVVTALAFLARYPGLAIVFTGIAAILFASGHGLRMRIRDSVIFISIACLPMAIWVIRNLIVAGNATGYAIVVRPPTFDTLRPALLTYSAWLIPDRIQGTLRSILVAGGAIGGLILTAAGLRSTRSSRVRRDPPSRELAKLPVLLATFVILYIGLLVASASLSSFWQAELGGRYQAPVFVSILVLSVCLGDELLKSAEGIGWLRLATMLLSILLAGFYLVRGTVWVIGHQGDGQGYASKLWRQSVIVESIKALPAGINVYSNADDAIYILTGKATDSIPAKIDSRTGRLNNEYASQMGSVADQLRNRSAVLVYFHSSYRPYLPSEEELQRILPVRVIETGPDGSIYGGR
jgi:hypothetical protein